MLNKYTLETFNKLYYELGLRYEDFCPKEWIEAWDEARKAGKFAGPEILNRAKKVIAERFNATKDQADNWGKVFRAFTKDRETPNTDIELLKHNPMIYNYFRKNHPKPAKKEETISEGLSTITPNLMDYFLLSNSLNNNSLDNIFLSKEYLDFEKQQLASPPSDEEIAMSSASSPRGMFIKYRRENYKTPNYTSLQVKQAKGKILGSCYKFYILYLTKHLERDDAPTKLGISGGDLRKLRNIIKKCNTDSFPDFVRSWHEQEFPDTTAKLVQKLVENGRLFYFEE